MFEHIPPDPQTGPFKHSFISTKYKVHVKKHIVIKKTDLVRNKLIDELFSNLECTNLYKIFHHLENQYDKHNHKILLFQCSRRLNHNHFRHYIPLYLYKNISSL